MCLDKMSNIHTLLLLNYQLYFYISPTENIAIMMRYQKHTQQQKYHFNINCLLKIPNISLNSLYIIYIIHYTLCDYNNIQKSGIKSFNSNTAIIMYINHEYKLMTLLLLLISVIFFNFIIGYLNNNKKYPTSR